MPKFATAFISFLDNEMKMEIIEAKDEFTALKHVLGTHDTEIGEETTCEELKVQAWNCDSMVGAIEIEEK